MYKLEDGSLVMTDEHTYTGVACALVPTHVNVPSSCWGYLPARVKTHAGRAPTTNDAATNTVARHSGMNRSRT